jgi:hypothetical protein
MGADGTAIFGVFLTVVAAAGTTHKASVRVRTPQIPEFQQRIQKYMEVRRMVEARVPPVKDKATSAELTAHKQALGDLIRDARRSAKQGDIFAASVQPFFVRVVRSEVRGASGSASRDTIMKENPNQSGKAKLGVAVNAKYPDTAPATTMPPTLLLRLPELPDHLEYRFVGKDLVLCDADADLIVDFIPNALS